AFSPTPARRLPARRPAGRLRRQRLRPAAAHPAAPAPPAPGRPDRLRDVGRLRRGLRGLGRLRLVEGGAGPDRRRPRRGAPRALGLRRRPRRHEHPDAPGGLPRRGHLRPAAARGERPRPAGAAHRAPAERPLPGPGTGDTGRGRPMRSAPPLVGLPPAPGPIEASGRRRDAARLLVTNPSTEIDTTFAALGEFLDPGDVLVVNTSATLPAAVPVEGPRLGRVGGDDAARRLLHLGSE